MKRAGAILWNIVFYVFLILVLGGALLFALNPSSDKTIFGYRAYEVLSGSMSPAIKVGDLVLVKKTDAGEVKTGDVVTYFADDGQTTVTHRVIDMTLQGDQIVITTQGDNVDQPDQPISGDRVLGVVTCSIPKVGGLLGSIRENPAGALIILVVVLAVIGLLKFAVSAFFGKDEEEPEDTQEKLE